MTLELNRKRRDGTGPGMKSLSRGRFGLSLEKEAVGAVRGVPLATFRRKIPETAYSRARLRKTDSRFVNELQNHDREGAARNLEFCVGI